ncbi:MAG: methyltransferase domain-containing protein [Desulfovibrio desulfuricans]|nr:methyltransferase domain-containing protein [Desulfovibrio desulfuricans]
MNSSYQDYVIRDGKFIGDFETMYQNFEDPWEQSKAPLQTEKIIALHLLKKYKCKTVIEFGCGLGHFTSMIKSNDIDVIGVDTAESAIKKARLSYPHVHFEVGDILDFDIYKKYKPQCIVMAEITWYILDKLKEFLHFYGRLKNVYLLHLLTFYAPGVQKYGRDYFSNFEELLHFFDLYYEEYGQIFSASNMNSHSYFLAHAHNFTK